MWEDKTMKFNEAKMRNLIEEWRWSSDLITQLWVEAYDSFGENIFNGENGSPDLLDLDVWDDEECQKE